MKKILSFILAVALLSALAIMPAQAANTAEIALVSTYETNGTYEVTATIKSGTVTNGEIFINVGTEVTLTSLTSTLDADIQSNLRTDGVLAVVFAPQQAVDTANGVQLFKAVFALKTNVTASDVVAPALSTTDSSIVQYIAPTATTPTDYAVSLDVTGFNVVKPAFTLGDVNEDKVVNAMDLQRLYEHLNGSNPLTEGSAGLSASDVNEDKVVNAMDLQRLYEHLNGSNPLN